MMRTTSLSVRSGLYLFLGLAMVSPCPAAARPPNVVFFLVDDLGWADLEVQGSTFYETRDLSDELPERTAELRKELRQWQESIDAKMPRMNPNRKTE
ncbi:MAG: hypothetical protein ACOC7K_00615 [bacterium]